MNNKIANMLKGKKILYILLAFTAILLWSVIIFLVNKDKNMSKQPEITPKANLSRSDLYPFVPGTTKEEDVIKELGSPIDEATIEGQKVDSFTSSVNARPHQATFVNGTLRLFVETVDANKTASLFKEKFGEETNKLYRSQVVGGAELLIYPDKGFAYLSHPRTQNVVTEIWYFAPTTLEEFKAKYAPEYFDSVPLSPTDLPAGYR